MLYTQMYNVCEIGLFMPRFEQNPRYLANEIVQISPFNCFEELPYWITEGLGLQP
jgi:hypothetical protein